MRQTLGASVSVRGITLHGGQKLTLTLHPAPAGTGIRFRRTDRRGRGAELPALWRYAIDSRLCTTLQDERGIQVRTVEHLLFALAVLGIDDLVAEIDGDELPILDGSGAPFVELVASGGVARSDQPRSWIEVLRPVAVADGVSHIALAPCPVFAIDLAVPLRDFGLLRWQGTVTPDTLRTEIAPARTYGAITQALPAMILSRLGLMRLLRGASLSCALVLHRKRVLNPGGFRLPDEMVRHRVLDCVGDMMLAGAPLRAQVTAHRTRHSLNRRLLAALHADPGAWRWTTEPPAEPPTA
jgi:UDP-3-O-[3-hydroxymyristoyl] N-acetylglucosamine deacetylase